MLRASLALLLVASLAACGSSGTTSGGPGVGSGSVGGSVAGSTFYVASGLAADYSAAGFLCSTEDGGSSTCFEGNVFIGLANRGGDVCPAVSSPPTNTVTELANVDALELNVFNANGPVTARTYEVAPSGGITDANRVSSAVFSTTTSTCATGVYVGATSGTITVTEFSAARIVGTYSLTFGTQGSFSGTFDAPICPLSPPTQASGVPVMPVVTCE